MTTTTENTKSSFQPNPDITPDELEVMRKDVEDRVIIARVGLLLRHPFFGNIATRLRVQNCDDWCPTAATDGRNLYYNTQFFNAMSNKEIEFVIAHEILHCIFDHLTRREDRDAMLFNIACDYLVNNTLVRDRIGDMPSIVPCFQDWKYSDWSAEQVYDDLLQEAEEKGKEFLEELGELLDEHVDWESDPEDDDDGDSEKEGKSKRPKYSKEEMQKIRDEMKEAMIQSAQAAGAGNVPGEVARMIKELTEPKMNWREIIRQQIQSTIRNDFTFVRPSRKAWHTGAILPGQNFDESIDVAVALDVSGSISDNMLKDFLSEVKGIMEEFKDYNVKIWCFDTEVSGEDNFSSDDARDLLDYEITGGGGTDFMANWTYMKEQDITPKKLIVFTDGYPWGSWGDEDYCDTIFVVHSNHNANLEAPFGLTTHYDAKAA